MHERQVPEAVRNMRDFYDWLVAPIIHELRLLRAEQTEFRKELIRRLRTMEREMLVETQELITKVEKLTSASDSVQAVVDKILGMIASSTDLAALKKAAADIDRESDELIAAALRGTPAEEPPPVDPNAPPV